MPLEKRVATCGCKVSIQVDTLGHHLYDGVSSVEITEPCETHQPALIEETVSNGRHARTDE